MSELPAPHENAGIVARLSIGGGIAALAAFFPRHAAALAMIPPFAIAALEARCKRCEGILIEALRKGGIEDLSSEKAAAFIPMGLRLMQAAQQGEIRSQPAPAGVLLDLLSEASALAVDP